MGFVVLERANNGGEVTINTMLVREIQTSAAMAPFAATKLIFDEADQFDVVGNPIDIAEIIGFEVL